MYTQFTEWPIVVFFTLFIHLICPEYQLYICIRVEIYELYPMILTDQLSNAEVKAIHFLV